MENETREDLLIDLGLQCNVVRHAWEQQQAHECHGKVAFKAADRQKVAQAVSSAWQQSMEGLAAIAGKATELGVPSDILLSVLDKYLPSEVAARISAKIPDR